MSERNGDRSRFGRERKKKIFAGNAIASCVRRHLAPGPQTTAHRALDGFSRKSESDQ